MLMLDHFHNAYHSLKSNRGRTFLTTLGITIGVASVTAILALSSGVNNILMQQVNENDGNIAIIRPGIVSADPNVTTNPLSQRAFSTSTLTEEDIEIIRNIEGIKSVAPLMTIDGTMKSQNGVTKNGVVVATTPDFIDTTPVIMKQGQFLDEITDNETAVVGYDLALELFGTDRPVGFTLTLRGQQLTVIGVMKRSTHPINYNGVDLNHAVVINFDQGKLFHQGRTQIQQINFAVNDVANMTSITDKVNEQILKAHLGERDFKIASGKEVSRPTNDLFRAIVQVMAAIAGISLIVGGIGIMNIMLVNVAERTREVGIRKAVGASNGTIVSQFLVESLMISVFGGLVGYVLGYLVAFFLSQQLYFTPGIDWLTAGVAATMAVGVGVLFGLYPALKAARKDTIESLRQYQ